MLKVQYYKSRSDLMNDSAGSGGRTVVYSEDMFRELMVGGAAEEERPPFRDAESRMILKESFGIEPVEDDWYSIIVDGRRTCFSELSADLKYALVLIDRSRAGYFLTAESMQEPVWNAVSKVAFDILVACTWEDIFWTSCKLPRAEYIIYGLPYGGGDGIHVRDIDHTDGFYTPLCPVKPGGDRGGTDIAKYLYIGRDGRYYTNALGGILRFFWRKHLDEMLDYIDKLEYPKKLKKIDDTYSLFEFGRMIEPTGSGGLVGYVCRDYLWELNLSKADFKAGRITAAEYRAARDMIREFWGYEDYLYYRDTFKVVNHMYQLPPKEMDWRKVPILSVRMNRDGSYVIGGGISFKYPWQEEILGEAIAMCSDDHDTFILYVNVDEIIDRPEDLDKTTWAVWVRQDSIELFDKWDGLRLFAAAVREALASGRCEIIDEFY